MHSWLHSRWQASQAARCLCIQVASKPLEEMLPAALSYLNVQRIYLHISGVSSSFSQKLDTLGECVVSSKQVIQLIC